MTTEELIIAAVRIGGALLVLRWAFAGSIAAILIDFSDLFMMNLLDLGGVRNYQALDKWLDLAYMLTFLWVALRWTGPPRTIAAALFAYRILGVLSLRGRRQPNRPPILPQRLRVLVRLRSRRPPGTTPTYDLTWPRSG